MFVPFEHIFVLEVSIPSPCLLKESMVLFCYDPKQNRQGATENLGDLGLNQPKLVDLNHICGDNIDMFIAIFSSAEVFSYNDHSCFLDFMVDPS